MENLTLSLTFISYSIFNLGILMALTSKYVQNLTTSPILVQVIIISFLNYYNHLLFDFTGFILAATPYLSYLQYGSKGVFLKKHKKAK